ncbi:MAG: hypothetical protein Q9172_007167 [Xanthocarpia lactea]
MQQQYSQKTPTKGTRRRRGNPSPTASPAVMVGSKKASKRRTSPEEDDSSDADSGDESAEHVTTKASGGFDGPADTDNDSDSAKEPASARKQRLRRRLNLASVNDDEDEPVYSRPRRTRASVVNYNLLQNSGYDQDDQGEEAPTPSASNEPIRMSKIIALKMGIPKTPVVENRDVKTRRAQKSLNIDTNDETTTPTLREDGSTRRMSTRGKKLVNGKTDNLASPASFAADEDTSISGSRRKRRSLFPQDPEPNIETNVAVDTKVTRSSRKRKNSEVEVTETRPKKVVAVESAPEEEEQPSKKKKRHGKPKEHLGFLPNGQPRQRRRRVSKAIIM